MSTTQRVWSGIAAGFFGLATIGALSGGAGPVSASPLAGDSEPPARTTVTVTDVLDGDTFVADGRQVHVLGIDSCPVSTRGGQAALQMADAMLAGHRVTLRSQPGVDQDASGRMLRYVDLANDGDYGDFMVTYAHTGADAAGGASRNYVASLRDDDPNGRSCS